MKEYISIIGLISIIIVIGSYIINRRGDTGEEERISQYECGEEVMDIEREEKTMLYRIKYYKIALTYLVFDIETILLFPSSMISITTYLTNIILYSFISIIIIGLYYEYFNKVFE